MHRHFFTVPFLYRGYVYAHNLELPAGWLACINTLDKVLLYRALMSDRDCAQVYTMIMIDPKTLKVGNHH